MGDAADRLANYLIMIVAGSARGATLTAGRWSDESSRNTVLDVFNTAQYELARRNYGFDTRRRGEN